MSNASSLNDNITLYIDQIPALSHMPGEVCTHQRTFVVPLWLLESGLTILNEF
jgi:hypothetical protein